MAKGCVLRTGYLPRGGLPRNSVDRLTDRPDMTSAVDRGCKASTQIKQTNTHTRVCRFIRTHERWVRSSLILQLIVAAISEQEYSSKLTFCIGTERKERSEKKQAELCPMKGCAVASGIRMFSALCDVHFACCIDCSDASTSLFRTPHHFSRNVCFDD